MKTCALIYNPNSGKILKSKHIKEYLLILKKNGYNVKVFETEYSGHAKEIVNHLDDIDLVISMGGDGTFNEIMSGNLKREKRLVLAHIPVGTTNDIGIMFGYGKNMVQNLKDLLKGEVKNMDICLINGNPFVYVAGFGKFTDIPYDTPRDLKKKLGFLAYLTEGIKDFFKPTKLYDITYKVDGLEKNGKYSFVLISNSNRIAGINNFYKDIKLDDNQFEVLLCNFNRRLDIIRTFSLLLTGNIENTEGFEFFRTDHLEISFDNLPKKAWCIDGEKLNRKKTSYEVTIENNIEIMLPKKNIKKIFTK